MNYLVDVHYCTICTIFAGYVYRICRLHYLRIYLLACVFVYIYMKLVDVLQERERDCNRLQQTTAHSIHTAGGCAAGYAIMMCAIFTILYLYVCIYVDAGDTYIYILTYISIHIHMYLLTYISIHIHMCMYDLLLSLDHQVMKM